MYTCLMIWVNQVFQQWQPSERNWGWVRCFHGSIRSNLSVCLIRYMRYCANAQVTRDWWQCRDPFIKELDTPLSVDDEGSRWPSHQQEWCTNIASIVSRILTNEMTSVEMTTSLLIPFLALSCIKWDYPARIQDLYSPCELRVHRSCRCVDSDNAIRLPSHGCILTLQANSWGSHKLQQGNLIMLR